MEEVNDVDTDSNFNVYVGSENGVLKGVYFGHEVPRLKNFHSFESVSASNSISNLSWMDNTQKEILVSFKSQFVKTYNRKLRSFTAGIKLEVGEGEVVGVHSYSGSYLIGTENGKVRFWDYGEDESLLEVTAGRNISAFRQCPHEKNIFATGGEETNLKIWNLDSSKPSEPVFAAKNFPNDELDLKQPVWVQDLTFLPMSNELVAICTRYGQVRLYDPKVDNKNRPVINLQLYDHPLMAISSTLDTRQVVVGSSQGKVSLVDFRKTSLCRTYGGFSGSIRSISAHPEAPYFVSCGLDRHLYLHHLNQRQPVKKLYLKSRLSCVLMADDFKTDFLSEKDTEKVHWQNIDMETLDVAVPNAAETVSPKKRKVQR